MPSFCKQPPFGQSKFVQNIVWLLGCIASWLSPFLFPFSSFSSSPLQELIQETPNSLASLLEHLLPRLQPRAEVRGVSLEDQQNFVSVVTLLFVVICLFIYLFFWLF